MRTSLSKEFTFHAAHRDESAGGDDACGRVHGHTYTLRVTVEGPLNERHMVIHGNELKWVYKAYVEPWVEHQDLNKTMMYLPAYADDLGKAYEGPHTNPTMENLALRLLWAFKAALWSRGHSEDLKISVRLWETPTMFCDVFDSGYGED